MYEIGCFIKLILIVYQENKASVMHTLTMTVNIVNDNSVSGNTIVNNLLSLVHNLFLPIVLKASSLISNFKLLGYCFRYNYTCNVIMIIISWHR